MTIHEMRMKRMRSIISSRHYNESRANGMNNSIQYWRDLYGRSNTRMGRDFCEAMINMYLKRYIYYCKKN